MSKASLSLVLLLLSTVCFSQNVAKPSIPLEALGKWPSVIEPTLSDDGEYLAYCIKDVPVGSKTLVFKSSFQEWEKIIPNFHGEGVCFTKNSKMGIYSSNDSLHLLKLGTNESTAIPNVISFKVSRDLNYVCYLTTDNHKLVIRDLVSGRERELSYVTDYSFNETGSVLVCKTKTIEGSMEQLNVINLKKWDCKEICRGIIRNIVVNPSGNLLAFIKSDDEGKSIWYYRTGMQTAFLLANNKALKEFGDFNIDRIDRISSDEQAIFFEIQQNRTQRKSPNKDFPSLDVWSYGDMKLQSQQLSEVGKKRSYAAIVKIKSKVVKRLEEENEHILSPNFTIPSDKVLVISNNTADIDNGEESWNIGGQVSYSLMDTDKDIKKPLPKHIKGAPHISPTGRYLIFYDCQKRDYFSFNIASGETANITHRISTEWTAFNVKIDSTLLYNNNHYSIAGWTENDSRVILYDQKDIWMIDPLGMAKPINITNSDNLDQDIVFRIAKNQLWEVPIFRDNEELLLSAFNLKNKQNGFYSVALNAAGSPKLLTMGPYIYYAPNNDNSNGILPIKARSSKTYLVTRMNAQESPNYFVTKDFKTFKEVSHLYPENEFNWFSTELMEWNAFDSTKLQGILYKPENFNPHEKYPLIIHYYMTKSHRLNEYITPAAFSGEINIPWLVSRGYLVFTPDIIERGSAPGEAAYNCVVSAAKYLSKFNFIEPRKIGIQGFSYGGYRTNYLIANTNMFAAAISGAGATDLISSYGGLFDNGSGPSLQAYMEIGQFRMNSSPWHNLETYVKNSPLFNVEKVVTPLLMMHNKKDDAVDFRQAIEFFTALRRLGKRVWLLQYDNGGHGVDGRDAVDYTIRATQFFDHYLKGKPAPRWMLKGVPAELKGMDLGLSIDSIDGTPQEGKILLKSGDATR